MTNSSYRQPPTDTTDLATGYYRNGTAITGKYHVYPEQAAAGLWTTPTDLAKYIIDCQLTLDGKPGKVLNKEMMEKRMSFYIDSTVGQGVFLTNRGGMKYFNHNGGNEAFLCTSYGSFKEGNGVVIMVNGENFAVVSELLNSVATVYGWTGFYTPTMKKIFSPQTDSLQQFVGDYLLGRDTITLLSCKQGLCIQQNRHIESQFAVIFSEPLFFSIREVPGADFRAIRDTAGKIDALELTQNGNVMRLPRIKGTANKAP